jgi:hypothetical protein
MLLLLGEGVQQLQAGVGKVQHQMLVAHQMLCWGQPYPYPVHLSLVLLPVLQTDLEQQQQQQEGTLLLLAGQRQTDQQQKQQQGRLLQ